MFLRTDEIGEETRSFEHRLEIPALRDEGGEPLTEGPVRIRGTVRREDHVVDLRATVEARLSLGCSRCLERYRAGLDVGFRLRVVGEAVEFGAVETRIEEADASVFYSDGGQVDLAGIGAEQVYLNLPLKPVCSDACRGLCPTCGANRNRIECGCSREAVDPRLAPLKEIRKRIGGF